jgi:thymidylate synthase (FAD)
MRWIGVLGMTKTTQVLDHGFVELLDVMGSDEAIDAAARVSYVGGDDEERTPGQVRHLIRYLMRHHHTSPFEMAVLKFRVHAPIFVARQWMRHRTASINEISGRYAELPDQYYVPEPNRVTKQAENNKQGSSSDALPNAGDLAVEFRAETQAIRNIYQGRLDEGMARELARINLPVSQYTTWVWQINLHNLMHFLQLRMDSHAQLEIRVYAQAIAGMIQVRFPLTWEAFVDYRLKSKTFSRKEFEVLLAAANLRESVLDTEAARVGLRGRELEEFKAKFWV